MLSWPFVALLLAGSPAGQGTVPPPPPNLPPPASAAAPANSAAPPSLPTTHAGAPPPGATDAPGGQARANTHEVIRPADAEAMPGSHTRKWKPSVDLAHVPFPLERTRTRADGHRFRAPIVDLRDPFVHGRPGRPLPAELRRELLPDLKDPFILPRHPRPRGWKITLPGDIRDPFTAGNLRYRNACLNGPSSTRDGITIQRPSAGKPPPEQAKACSRVTRPLPADLLDPFRRK